MRLAETCTPRPAAWAAWRGVSSAPPKGWVGRVKASGMARFRGNWIQRKWWSRPPGLPGVLQKGLQAQVIRRLGGHPEAVPGGAAVGADQAPGRQVLAGGEGLAQGRPEPLGPQVRALVLGVVQVEQVHPGHPQGLQGHRQLVGQVRGVMAWQPSTTSAAARMPGPASTRWNQARGDSELRPSPLGR